MMHMRGDVAEQRRRQDRLRAVRAEPWMARLVLWASRDGVRHVAMSSATTGYGVVSRLACGGATTFWPDAMTWWNVRRHGQPVCRKCAAILRAAGEAGPIRRGTIG